VFFFFFLDKIKRVIKLRYYQVKSWLYLPQMRTAEIAFLSISNDKKQSQIRWKRK